MKGFTMQNVREMKNWSDIKLTAYGRACAKYAEQVSAFEGRLQKPDTITQPHCGIPNFKAIFAYEFEKASVHGKKATIDTVAS